jgi:hypothetical protein
MPAELPANILTLLALTHQIPNEVSLLFSFFMSHRKVRLILLFPPKKEGITVFTE